MKLEAQLNTKNEVMVVATDQRVTRYKLDEKSIDAELLAVQKTIDKFQARKQQLLVLKDAVKAAKNKKPKFVDPLPAEHEGKDDQPVDTTKPLPDNDIVPTPVDSVPLEVTEPVDEAMNIPAKGKKNAK